MKFGRSACLAGLVALGAWSVAACSSNTSPSTTDGGTDSGAGGSTGGSAGKGGTAGSAGTAGTAGTAGKGGAGGAAGSAGAAGAAGTPSVDGGFDGGAPSVKITSPAEGAMFTTTKIPVSFEVANFTLMPPGSGFTKCPKGTCGHVHINVDGNDCNVNATTALYNVAGNTSPLDVDLTLCKGGASGAHSIVASLHNDDHTAVVVGGTDVQSDPVDVKVTLSDGGTPDAGDGGK